MPLALVFAVLHVQAGSFASAQDFPLTLVMREHHEPFSYLDLHGQPEGLLVDLWRLWAQRTGRPVRFVLTDAKDLESWVLDGRADVWTGIFPFGAHPQLALSDPVMMLFRAPTVTAHDGVLGIRAAVRPDRTELLAEITQGFHHLTEEDRQSLLIRWWPQEGWIHLPRAHMLTAALLGGAFLLLWTVGTYLVYRFKLRGKAQELLAALAELRRKNNALESEIAERQQVEKDKERLIQELREALENVRKLRGLLPICAYCKKIRDDQGYWNQLESYITQHAEVTFTHSVCPECSKKIYAELKAFKSAEQQKKKAASG
ncbi:transporter substrate-binding domain-containing protein [Desulfosoma caldarium]|uniref:Extracellular solute-binding protein (Family 3) n=1 Tax=Desulfosoma caldarium TaxID=610254 RepID=A0A3N1UIY0_9BACT|nr:transporter substrate-binding domain-containing protein [Desulfosoma caldarium]ROQ91202.1 extracellular solute-binding protein (family 3) [Desulfosoma caldarium]